MTCGSPLPRDAPGGPCRGPGRGQLVETWRTGNRTHRRVIRTPVMGRLDDVDLKLKLSKEEAETRLEAAQVRLLTLRLVLGGLVGERGIGPPVCVLFEGWDASGKGGAIKRLVAQLDPRHVRVVQFAAPTYDEKRHHWLWRFWPALPGWGGMAVLDRSWYGRVLVERVEKFATPEQWGRAYEEINDFERMLTAEGMILVKFFVHLSDEEQLKRFEARERDPLKSWKLTDEDWRNRKQRKPLRRRDRGHARAHRHRVGAVAPGRGRPEAVGAREGRRDGQRRARGGHAGARHRPAARPSACGAPCARPSGRASSGARATWRSRACGARPASGARAPRPRAGSAGSVRRASREMNQPIPTKKIRKPPPIR